MLVRFLLLPGSESVRKDLEVFVGLNEENTTL